MIEKVNKIDPDWASPKNDVDVNWLWSNDADALRSFSNLN